MPKDAPAPVELPEDVWRRPEVLRMCRGQDADGLFRLARKHGSTNESIGYWTGIDPVEISKRITRGKGPVRTLDRWRRSADGLDMPDEARRELGVASREAGRRGSADQGGRTSSRRIDGAPVGTPAPAPRAALDPQLPETLLDLLAQYSRTDNMLGPRSLLIAVTSQLALVEQLWKVAADPIRTRLFEVGARYAEFAGWLHQDAGDVAAAAQRTLQALELAHAANSPVLASYVLMRRSNQESEAGDGPRALGLAAAALDVPEAQDPALRALALRQSARGHALVGRRGL